jgi:hypothetical protein
MGPRAIGGGAGSVARDAKPKTHQLRRETQKLRIIIVSYQLRRLFVKLTAPLSVNILDRVQKSKECR